ncbi:MAG: hemolysin family protein [Spirochaetes bacterium]|jgi:putative hemolysin|nr:hemolysin family protein [Spirochaetota bacterium]
METLFNKENLIYIAVIAVLMIFSSFFSAIETSLVSCSKINLDALLKKGRKNSEKAIYLLNNIEDAIGMILIGNNLANIGATAFITFIAAKTFNFSDTQILLTTVVQTIIFLIVCEVVPKVFGRAKAGQFLISTSSIMIFLMFLMKPVVKSSLLVSNLLKKLMKFDEKSNTLALTREEIDILFRLGGEAGIIVGDNQVFVSEILSFKSITASEVMTPTIDIVSIEVNHNVNGLIKLIADTKFSRIPVYQGRVDNIIGYVFYRDLLKNKNIKNITEVLYRIIYVPSTKSIYDLYQEMLNENVPLVFVVNEHGAVIGMVTHEDIAEELVGEIQTRDHFKDDLIMKFSGDKYLLHGNLDIDFFMKNFPAKIYKKNFSTLSGFLMHLTGKIPQKGERIKFDRYVFIIHEASERSIERVMMIISKKGGTGE